MRALRCLPPPCVTALSLWLALAGGARAQVGGNNPGLPQLPGVAAARGEAADAVRTPDAAPSASRASVDGTSLIGLREPTSRQVRTLAAVLASLQGQNADLQIASERLVQSEAGVRRAWSFLLPQLSLGGSYTHTCTGGTSGIDCADRSTQLVNKDQLEQQADLFDGISDLLLAVADGAQNPDDEAKLRADAADLKNAAKGVRATDTTPVVVQPASVWAGAATLTLPIFNGRSIPLMMNAYSAVEIATAARQQVQNALVYSAMRTYLAAVTAKKLTATSVAQLAQAQRHLELATARVQTSTAPPLAQKRAELDVLRARQQLDSAQASYDTAVAALGLVIGVDEAFEVDDVVTLPTLAKGAPDVHTAAGVDALAELAVDTRPDLVMQRTALRVAEHQVTDAWMMFLPSVNLLARASVSSFTSGFVKDPVTGTLVISATLPLYDGGARYAAMRDSTSKVREETIALRQLQERVRAQVRGNARDVAVRARAAALAQQTVAVADVAVQQAEAMFEVGAGTASDVSDSQLRLFIAQSDVLRTELDLALATTGLVYVSGMSLLDSAQGPRAP